MKKLGLIFSLLLSFCFIQNLKAQTLKIGVVDFQNALNSVEEGKSAKARLKAEFDQKQKSLDALQNDLKAMKDNLEKQKSVLSQDAMRQKEEEYRNKFIELNKKMAEFRAELQQKEVEYTGNILTALRKVVAEVGAKGNYTLIFEKGQDALLYAAQATDLTSEVISIYNSRKK